MTIPVLPSRFRPLPRPDWLPGSVWPFESFGVESEDSLLSVTDVGHGPTLLLAHVGTWSFIWRDLVTRLMPDFRCIFFDAPGTGRTQTPRRSDVSMAGAAQAITNVIEALELKDFTLVAHDLGGPASLAAIRSMPERVRGIVGMNAFGWRPTGAALRGMLALMGSRPMREIDVLTGFLPRITSRPFGVGRHMDEQSRAAFREGMGRRQRRSFHDYLRDARRCDDLYQKVEEALEGRLAHLPLLTVFGERNDPFGFQARWKKLFPEARQIVVSKGNHFPMCDAPDLVARTIRDWHKEHVMGAGGRAFRGGRDRVGA